MLATTLTYILDPAWLFFIFIAGSVIFSWFISYLYAPSSRRTSKYCYIKNQALIQGLQIAFGYFVIFSRFICLLEPSSVTGTRKYKPIFIILCILSNKINFVQF